MTVLQFNEIAAKHPLFRSNNLDGVLSYWYQGVNTFELAEFLPLVNIDADKVVVDVSKQSRGGMTPMVDQAAESPLFQPLYGRGRQEFEAATFREKTRIGIEDLYDLRVIGTHADLEKARTLLAAASFQMEQRLARRMEWLRRQVLFDREVRAQLEDGTEYVVEYAQADYLKKEVATSFDDLVNADPVDELQVFLDEYELDTGHAIRDIILPQGMTTLLSRNEVFRDLAKQNFGAFRGTRGEVHNYLIELLGVGSIRESKGFIQYQTDLTATAANGATTLQLRDASDLSEGDFVFIASGVDGSREKHLVTAVSGNTVTIDAPGVGRAGGFGVGDPVRFNRRVIPEGQILVIGNFPGPLNTEGELHPDKIQDPNRWGEIVSTRSLYADLENPRPGIYSRVIDKTDGDPPSIEYILGVRALPRINNPEAWMTIKAIK